MRAFVTLLLSLVMIANGFAAGGSLTLTVHDENTKQPTITRVQIWRGPKGGKRIPIRRTVSTGNLGIVLDRQVDLILNDSVYTFEMIRGPEYRIVTGNFTLEETSLDKKNVDLPRMVDMIEEGWTSGDCCVVAAPESLPLRMASEDLHVAAVLGHVDAKPIPLRESDDPIDYDPIWIREDAQADGGLVFYGDVSEWKDLLPSQRLAVLIKQNSDVRVGIENPFAWPLPVWLASGRIDGLFILGDWLRLDRRVLSVRNGRASKDLVISEGQAVGRWAEKIYRHALDAGLRIPPLAGGGSGSAKTPVGYNRLYVANQSASSQSIIEPVTDQSQWWRAAWMGQSVATNGPLLRPLLDGHIPGHVFSASNGEVLQLQPTLNLSVREKVEYLEVISNNSVVYSARLDEFAKAGGKIPKLEIDQSGWVIMRVVTLHEDHYRAAVTAPWYIDFEGKPRISKESVHFFTDWLTEYEARLKRLPPDQLKPHIPFVRAARRFWAAKAEIAVP